MVGAGFAGFRRLIMVLGFLSLFLVFVALIWGGQPPAKAQVSLNIQMFLPASQGGTAKLDGPIGGRTSFGSFEVCALVSNGTVKCWTNNLDAYDISGLTGVVAVANGGAHHCVALSNGNAKCWGRNTNGQLGDGTNLDKGSPATVVQAAGSPITGVTGITNGYDYSCALISDGTVRCWGINNNRQLGNGSNSDSNVATSVSNLTQAVSVTAGLYHTCALLSDRTAKCWGENSKGQLGLGSVTTSSLDPGAQVSGLSSAVAIAVGGQHTCALISDGTVKCWGYNEYGQLGDGTRTNRSTPVTVVGLSNVVQIALGNTMSFALISDGSVKVWGNPGFPAVTSPTTISGLSNVVAIAVNEFYSCALLSDGLAKCWGGLLGSTQTTVLNYNYQSGAAVVTGQNLVPLTIREFLPPSQGGNFKLDGPIGARSSGGYRHSCSLLSNGTAKCWGYNDSGQLGVPINFLAPYSLSPVSVTGLTNVVSVATGTSHSCALLSDGTAKCWGSNSSGQLGNPPKNSGPDPTSPSPTPLTVGTSARGFPLIPLTGIVAIAAGSTHNCAVLSNGNVACWGNNDFDQAGGFRDVHIVTGITSVVGVSAGTGFTCVLFGNGTALCFGGNNLGQLGIGSSTNLPVYNRSTRVVGLSGARALAGGESYTCALISDGSVKCWGDNSAGQIGDGTFNNIRTSAVATSGLNNVQQIAAGGAHSCALISDGTAKCWGWNGYGQIGDGSTPSWPYLKVNPVSVLGLNNAVAISAGNPQSCALISDGTAKCWGASILGDGSTRNSNGPVTVVNYNYGLRSNTPSVIGFNVDNIIPSVRVTQANNGTGVVTFSFKIRDAEVNKVTLNNFQYSIDGGATFIAPGDTSVALSTGWPNKGGAKYTTAATLAAAPVEVFTVVTKFSGLAPLNRIDSNTIRFIFKANDGTVDSSFAVTENVSLDNKPPDITVPANIDSRPISGGPVRVVVAFGETHPNINQFQAARNNQAYGPVAPGQLGTATPPPQDTQVQVGSTLDGDDVITKVRVRHEDALGNSIISENINLASNLATVRPLVPAAPTVSQISSTSVNVKINPNPSELGDVQYAIQFDSNPTQFVQADGSLASSPVFQTFSQWGGSGGKIVFGLNPSFQYTVTTKARNPNGDQPESASSPAFVLAPANTKPNTPILIKPVANVSTCVSDVDAPLNPVLDWNDFSDPDAGDTQATFQVQVDDTADFSSPLIDFSPLSSTASAYSVQSSDNLQYNTLYFWRVRVKDNGGLFSDFGTSGPAGELNQFRTPPHQQPTANFTFNPNPPLIGQETQFDASTSQAFGGSTIVNWRWNFGDSSPIVQGSDPDLHQKPKHTYTQGGNKTVNLRVRDSDNCEAQVNKSFSVSQALPEFRRIIPR